MPHDSENDPVIEDPKDKENRLAAYDLDGDGGVAAIEDAQARLGVFDARLEQAAEEGGVKGKIADAAHQLVDKLDND